MIAMSHEILSKERLTVYESVVVSRLTFTVYVYTNVPAVLTCPVLVSLSCISVPDLY